MNIVTKSESGNLVTTSLAIAEGVESNHASVIRLIRDNSSDFEEFGLLDFKSESTAGRPTEYAVLNEQQATLLLTYMRNSDIVREFKKRLVREFYELAKQAVPQTYAAALLEAGRLAQLAEEQAEKLAIAAPKVQFVDTLVERGTLMTATQVGQKHKISAVKLNRILDEVGGIYSKGVKRSRVFTQQWIDKGYGEMKQTELGHSQALFTPSGEYRISEILTSEGLI